MIASGGVAYVLRTDARRELTPGRAPFSSLASLRLRVLIPGSELARRAKVTLVPFDHFLADPALSTLPGLRAIVLGKLSVSEVETMDSRLERLFQAIERCPHPVFADFSDNYAALAETRSSVLRDYQTRMSSLARLTVPCEALAQQLAPHAKQGIDVVEDPYEIEQGSVRFDPGAEVLHCCWFGASFDTDSIHDSFVSLVTALRDRRVRIDFVAGAARRPFAQRLAARLSDVHGAVNLSFIEWSVQRVATALARCDLVLLPQDYGSDWGRTKSHNRLVQAIRAGRIALASPIPSYLELADYACVGEDFAACVREALRDAEDMTQRVREGQALVRDRFSPERIAERWAQILGVV